MATRYDLRPVDRRSLWRENHGNFLLAFAGVILLIGLAFLGYRQWRPAESHIRYIRAQPQALDAPVEGDENMFATPDDQPSLQAPADTPAREPADADDVLDADAADE